MSVHTYRPRTPVSIHGRGLAIGTSRARTIVKPNPCVLCSEEAKRLQSSARVVAEEKVKRFLRFKGFGGLGLWASTWGPY